MSGVILAINCGSSSLKFGLFDEESEQEKALCEGEAEEIGGEHGSFTIKSDGKSSATESKSFSSHADALNFTLDRIGELNSSALTAVSHRFVHGGPHLSEHQIATAEVEKQLLAAVQYAPLHLPSSLSALQAIQKRLPQIPQVICFDTAFHRQLPAVSRLYPLPSELEKQGVRRYGFHGISLESIVAQLKPVPSRLVVAHLGNGSSITAIRDGRSIDTSMGMTPSGGVMMGTRCGDVDPGLLLYLLRHGYEDFEDLESLIDHHSGLLAVSGRTSDVRELLSLREHDGAAKLALDMFCYQVRKQIASMAAALGGFDALVFTGGIGEHAAEIRAEICNGLGFLGLSDWVTGLMLPSQEDLQLVRNARVLLSRHPAERH